jgi:hypothetical protein
MRAKFINEAEDPIQSWEKKTTSDIDSEFYHQLCVWTGTVLGDSTVEDFEQFFKDQLGVRVKFMEEVVTLPGQGGEGGRHDVFFYVHDADVAKFAIPRLQFGISWWEDVIENKRHLLYPSEIVKKYPKTW